MSKKQKRSRGRITAGHAMATSLTIKHLKKGRKIEIPSLGLTFPETNIDQEGKPHESKQSDSL